MQTTIDTLKPVQLAEKQYSPEWYENRKGKVSASIAGAILNMPDAFGNYESTMRDLVRAHHNVHDKVTTMPMKYGSDTEATARDQAELDLELFFEEQGMYAHSNFQWLIASPDGKVVGQDVGLEIKCPFHKSFLNDTTDVDICMKKISAYHLTQKPSIFLQMQIQMYVMGWKAIWYYVYTPLKQAFEYVDFDDDYRRTWLPKLQFFYDEFTDVVSDPQQYEPMLRPSKIDLSEEKAFVDVETQLKAVQDKIKGLVEEEKILKDQLIDQAGQHDTICVGKFYTVSPRKGSTRIDYARLVKEKLPTIDLQPYEKTGEPGWTITMKKEAAA